VGWGSSIEREKRTEKVTGSKGVWGWKLDQRGKAPPDILSEQKSTECSKLYGKKGGRKGWWKSEKTIHHGPERRVKGVKGSTAKRKGFYEVEHTGGKKRN